MDARLIAMARIEEISSHRPVDITSPVETGKGRFESVAKNGTEALKIKSKGQHSEIRHDIRIHNMIIATRRSCGLEEKHFLLVEVVRNGSYPLGIVFSTQ